MKIFFQAYIAYCSHLLLPLISFLDYNMDDLNETLSASKSDANLKFYVGISASAAILASMLLVSMQL